MEKMRSTRMKNLAKCLSNHCEKWLEHMQQISYQAYVFPLDVYVEFNGKVICAVSLIKYPREK